MDSEGVRVCNDVMVAGLSMLAFGVDTPSPDVDIMDAEKCNGPNLTKRVVCLVMWCDLGRDK